MDITKRIDLLGLVSLAVYISLLFINKTNSLSAVMSFLSVMLIEWGIVSILFFMLGQQTPKKILIRIIFWSILFQVVGLYCQPILEDDYFRYIWDGYIFSLTGNPYLSVPADYFGKTLPNDIMHVLDRLNYPFVSTIYGPVCQYVFLIANLFRPHQLFVIKSVLLAGNVMTMSILLQLTQTRYFLLFAWCPLLIIETVFEAHIDGVGITFLLAAVFLHVTSTKQPYNSWLKIATMVSCAFAVAAKLFAAPLACLLLLRYSFRYWVLFVVALAAMYFPFMLHANVPNLSAINAFYMNWQFNSSLYAVFTYWLGALNARLLSLCLYFLVFSLIAYDWYCSKDKLIPRGDIVIGVMLLLSPVVNPWYLLWLLPFAALTPSGWPWLAIAIAPLSYLNGYFLESIELAPYQIPFPILFIEYASIFVILFMDSRKAPTMRAA